MFSFFRKVPSPYKTYQQLNPNLTYYSDNTFKPTTKYTAEDDKESEKADSIYYRSKFYYDSKSNTYKPDNIVLRNSRNPNIDKTDLYRRDHTKTNRYQRFVSGEYKGDYSYSDINGESKFKPIISEEPIDFEEPSSDLFNEKGIEMTLLKL